MKFTQIIFLLVSLLFVFQIPAANAATLHFCKQKYKF